MSKIMSMQNSYAVKPILSNLNIGQFASEVNLYRNDGKKHSESLFHEWASLLLSELLASYPSNLTQNDMRLFCQTIFKLDQIARNADNLADNDGAFQNLDFPDVCTNVFEIFGSELNSIFSALVEYSVYDNVDKNRFFKVINESIRANMFAREASYIIGSNEFNVNIFGYLYFPTMNLVKKYFPKSAQIAIGIIMKTYLHIINYSDDLIDLKDDIRLKIKTPLSATFNNYTSNESNINIVTNFLYQIEVWEKNILSYFENKAAVIILRNLELMKQRVRVKISEGSVRIDLGKDIIFPIFCYAP